MKNEKLTKFVGFHATEEEQAAIYARALIATGGNVSAHLRALAHADAQGQTKLPTGIEPDILERLAVLYRPRIAASLGVVLRRQAVDQPAMVERLLLELTDALALVPADEVHVSHVSCSK
jgi:hypothetical protein